VAGGRERNNERVRAEVPVITASGAKGVTRDMSPTGVYFTVDQKFRVGETIHFSMDFDAPPHMGGVFRMACVGTVVRVENAHGKSSVGVAITHSTLERRGRSGKLEAAAAG